MHRSQEIVLLLLQHIVIIGNARRDQFHHAALYQLFGQFRVFKLLAHSYFQSGANQLWQVRIQGMVRETSQFHVGGSTIGSFSEHDAQNLRRLHRVLAVSLVKIAHAKQQHRVRIFRLERVILFH